MGLFALPQSSPNSNQPGAMPAEENGAMPTQTEIDAAFSELLAMGFIPISGGEQTPEEIAAEAEAAAKATADAEAAKEAEAEKNLSDAGKAALKAEREARKSAAKEAAEAKAELETLRAEKAAAVAAKAKQDEADAIAKGEFQTLAEQRAEEVKTTAAERDALKSQNATLIAALKPAVESEWKDLPESLSKLYKGEKDDIVGKRIFLTDHAELITALAGKAEESKNKFRTGKVPIPNGGGAEELKSPLSAREIRGG